ncbi:methyltransferase domain-containing protein [Aerococcaceae bacterium WS4759]|uniref:Methyltransferase domain-containing protein n=1 Tax=Fundicoccus ignavus TaxID=2664442 RepID=A0A6I2GIA4_9LACT|nr:class I SAM-dependent methyltransferase [Fundicoccus ignavus]MRI86454.1 methyltransferase domain-containing protein [Fundicoccus ignavus]
MKVIGNTEQFDKMALRYDSPERIQIANIISEAMRDKITVGERVKAMDFGCGTGLIGLNLHDEFDEWVFVDASKEMLKQVDEKLAVLPINARTLQIDLENTTAEQEHFSCIVMSQVLLHIQDYQSVLKKLLDLLAPGGQLLIADFDENPNVQSDLVHPGFDRSKLASGLEDLGLEEVAAEIIYQADNLFMKQRAALFLMSGFKQA